jgi:cytochrome P450
MDQVQDVLHVLTNIGPLSLITLSVVLSITIHLLRNYITLQHIPGPMLASLTPLWRTYHQHNGTLRRKIITLHKQYGPIVKYAPSTVSIRDASAIQTIYSSVAGSKGGSFTINDSYMPLLGIDPKTKKDVRSLVTMEEAGHAKLRRAVAGAFSPNAVAEMEAILEQAMHELVEALDDAAATGREIDLSETLLFYSLDNATRMVFGEPGGHLRTNSDIQGLGAMIRQRFAHWGYWSSLPRLERWVNRNPIALYFRNSQPADFVRKAATKVAERVERPWLGSQPDLLNQLIKAREKYPEVMEMGGLMGIVMSTISGAADTTASTLAGILYFLATRPKVLRRLRKELEDVETEKGVPKFADTKGLPYLDAVVKESMRLFSLLNWPMERLVPEGGATFCDHVLPAGVSVGVLPAAMHMDQSVYGSDVEIFRPERWLSGDADVTRKMEASFLGFSRGKRVCLGQNIAVVQLKKVVPAVVWRYEVRLVEEGAQLEADYSSAIVVMKPLLVRLRRREL